jgi:tRNA (cmo5U34)-methyltransferase
MPDTQDTPRWTEDLSRQHIDYGRYFIPEREKQLAIMLQLVKGIRSPRCLLELCCGDGLLAELLLGALPNAEYIGLDGSQLMLEQAGERLSRFGQRATLRSFELADCRWRSDYTKIGAVVSSLAIHHLLGTGKQVLFKDVYAMLDNGGVFIVADMIELVTPAGRQVAADAWDEVVHHRAIELDGNAAASDFFLQEGWNTYRYLDPDDIDHPSPLFDQLKWLEKAGFSNIEVHFIQAGHALFSGWK